MDPALSFANGWNQIYGLLISLPAELVAAAVIVQFWSTVSPAIWIVIFASLVIISNLFFVRVYGELEFAFASLKIMLIIGLNIMVRLIFDLVCSRVYLMLNYLGSCYHMRRRSRPPQIRIPILAQPGPLRRLPWLHRGTWSIHGILDHLLQRHLRLLWRRGHLHRGIRDQSASPQHPHRSQANLLAGPHLLHIINLHGRSHRAVKRHESPRLNRNRRTITLRHRCYASRHPSRAIHHQRRGPNQCLERRKLWASGRLPHTVWHGTRRARAQNLPPHQPVRHPLRRCRLLQSLHLPRLHDALRFG